MLYENIKELAKKYANANKWWKKSTQSMISSAEKDLLDKDIQEYNIKKEHAEQEIKRLYKEKEKIAEELKMESDKIKSTYLNNIHEQIKYIGDQKVNITTLISWSSTLIETIPQLQVLLQDNMWKINSYISDLNKISTNIWKDAWDCISKFKHDLEESVNKEKKQLSSELRGYYEQQKEKVKSDLEKSKKNPKIEYFWEESMKTYDEMKQWWLFSKYTLIITFSILIMLFDYLLISSDVGKAWWVWLFSDWQTTLMYKYILPFLFSAWIILTESITQKVLKSKTIKILITITLIIFSLILLLWPTLLKYMTGSLTINWLKWEIFVIWWRFLIYFILIPIDILLITKYVSWDYLKIYLWNIHYGFKTMIKSLLSPITWLFKVIKKSVSPINKRVFVNLSWFWLNFSWLPKNDLEKTVEHMHLLSWNVNSIYEKICNIRTHCKNVVKWLNWSLKVFDKLTKNLQNNFYTINNSMKKDLEDIETLENNKMENIQNIINWIAEELWKDEIDLRNARTKITEWVLEFINEKE